MRALGFVAATIAFGLAMLGCEEADDAIILDSPGDTAGSDWPDDAAGPGGSGGDSGPRVDASTTGGSGGSAVGGSGGSVPGGSGGGGSGGSGGEVELGHAFTEMVEIEDVVIDVSSKSGFHTIELPDDILSLTLVGIGMENHVYIVEHLEGPDGQILIAEEPPGVTITSAQRQAAGAWAGQFFSPNRVSPTEAVTATLAPNTPEVELTGGEWTFRFAGVSLQGFAAHGPVEVYALLKRGPAHMAQGVLPLHFYFTGSRGWTAEAAPDSADFGRALDHMATLYAEIGVTVVPMTYQDIDPSFREITMDYYGQSPELHELYSQSVHDDGVNLFFVDSLGPPGSPIGGIAGGIPGPNLISGTSRSGVVINAAMDFDPKGVGHVMAHETGHFLGLFHTSEITMGGAGINDPLDDTPEGRAGVSNLMFPTAGSNDASLTEDQGFVIRANATIVQEAGQEEGDP